MRKLIWLGLIVGSSAGGMAPRLWGGSALSGWGLLCSMIGGIAGIWAGYMVGRAVS